MDEKELQQQIALYYSKLPSDMQEIFSKMEWLETLKQISTKYGLGDEQIQALGTEITLVLLGIIHLDEYENQVKNELDLSKIEALKMLKEINISILQAIKPQLSTAFDKNKEELKKEHSQIEEKLDERFDSLSEEIKKIIIESNYHASLFAIATENNLSVPEIGTLEEITTKVITGSIHPNEFEKRLTKNLGRPEGLVKKVASEINNKILKIIREKMEEVYSKPKNTIYDIKPVKMKEEVSSLNEAGIKIIKPNLNLLELNAGTAHNASGTAVVGEEKSKNNIPVLNSALNQKLNTPSKTSTIKTDHSVGNITKSTNINDRIVRNYSPKADPYREVPE